MKVTAQEIAERMNGTVEGNPAATAQTPARIEYAKSDSICFFANPKYENYVYTSKAAIILVNKSFVPQKPVPATMVRVDDAYQAVAELLDWFSEMKRRRRTGNWLTRTFCRNTIRGKVGRHTWVGPYAYIDKGARIGADCQIYPHVYIGRNVTIGDGVTIYSGAKIYQDCVIGNNCILHAGCVIGADGFGFAPREDGTYKKIQQTGNVVIEDDVEIGANTCVDRAAMGSTIVHKGTKLDDLVMVAHNVEIGENCVMAGQTGIAGSAHIGHNCVFGGQVGIGGHITVAPKSTAAAKTVIAHNIKEEGKTWMGNPALEYMQYMRAYANFKKNGTSTTTK
ncbi:MAG: UDP-3-O-(3-hydroxymyristoyl)glucosamine N-acyltransferase [Bacteroidales bacterium]|nr:UDP-3-O-(3-hydroxymyristoyl)glucosamine N-acyltransferase [Bacteroidales bacterium]